MITYVLKDRNTESEICKILLRIPAGQPLAKIICGEGMGSGFPIIPERDLLVVSCRVCLNGTEMNLELEMRSIGRRARLASHELGKLTAGQRDRCLNAMADAIGMAVDRLVEANSRDLEYGKELGLSSAMMDRLKLTPAGIAGMARGLREVAALPDPTGRILESRELPNGLRLEKVSCALGVIVIIYESRPNVTADAAGLCFKAGSATILRGGKEAMHSNSAIAEIMNEAARKVEPEFPVDAVQVIQTADRQAIPALLSLTEYVDLCMPRGGEGLIRAVMECSRVPVIKHYTGVCHVYIHQDADPDMALAIVINAKCQRPGVCNAAETLLIDQAVAPAMLPAIAAALWGRGVELRGDPTVCNLLAASAPGGKLTPAQESDWPAEYLDLILAVRVVSGLDEAVSHINQYGSGHSDAIITSDARAAERFMNEVDSATVYWNASTRFTDGAQFGMGAEIGISTDKIGARGPMGLNELTTYKWKIFGHGQIRP